MVLSIISSVIAVQQVFMSITWATTAHPSVSAFQDFLQEEGRANRVSQVIPLPPPPTCITGFVPEPVFTPLKIYTFKRLKEKWNFDILKL